MSTQIQLPKLYENMDEATIGPWSVSVGQQIKQGDVLVQLISDKVVEDFEAPCDGTILGIFAQEKSTVPLGYVICAIGEAGEAVPDVAASNEELMKSHLQANALSIDLSGLVPEAAPQKPAYKVAPAAKAFAKQNNVSLDDVAAFCKRDTIHRKDVEDYIASQKGGSTAAEAAPAPAVQVTPAPAAAPKPAQAAAPTAAIAQRVALITGSSGAIGSAIARALSAKGIAVALHCNSNTAKAEALGQELSPAPAAVFTADLASSAACKQLVQDVLAKWGRIDILVNNAGRLDDATVSFMTDEKWLSSIELNLNAPFRLMREVSMPMARQRWGRIVSLASDAGRMGSANRSNYAAAKEGLVGLTRSAALEMAGLGIRVNAVSPGFIESPMTANIPPVKMKEVLRQIPTRRLGKPQDVAALVAFLCSDEADYITGQVISIDGGLFMG